jgi:hypothetical protein
MSKLFYLLLFSLILNAPHADLSAQEARIKSDCSPACTEVRRSDGQWALITTDASGNVLDFHQTQIPETEPFDLWFELQKGGGQSKTGDAPNPPPGGTGTVTESGSNYGTGPGPNGQPVFGIWYWSTAFIFADGVLVDVQHTTHFHRLPIPPPGDGQVN